MVSDKVIDTINPKKKIKKKTPNLIHGNWREGVEEGCSQITCLDREIPPSSRTTGICWKKQKKIQCKKL